MLFFTVIFLFATVACQSEPLLGRSFDASKINIPTPEISAGIGAISSGVTAENVTNLSENSTGDMPTNETSSAETPTVISQVDNSTLTSVVGNETTTFVPFTFLPPPYRNESSFSDQGNWTDEANAKFLAAAGAEAIIGRNTPTGSLQPTANSKSLGFPFGLIESPGSGSGAEEDDSIIMNGSLPETKLPAGGDILSGIFGGGFGTAGDEEGNLKCFACESCPESTEKMRKETCIDFSALCVTKVSYTMRRGKLYFVRKSRFCGPASCPPSSLMSRFHCCSGDLCNGSPSRTDAERVAIALASAISAILARIFNR